MLFCRAQWAPRPELGVWQHMNRRRFQHRTRGLLAGSAGPICGNADRVVGVGARAVCGVGTLDRQVPIDQYNRLHLSIKVRVALFQVAAELGRLDLSLGKDAPELQWPTTPPPRHELWVWSARG